MSDPLILIYNFPAGFEYKPPIIPDTFGITSIDWGDGTTNTIIPHFYSTSGQYTVQIYGSEVLYMTSIDNSQPNNINTSAPYLIRCTSFGNIGIQELYGGFTFCTNLIEVPTTLPVTVMNLEEIFSDTTYNGTEITNWNVSNVTNMVSMFRNSPFNQPIGNWNVSNVTNMGGMFRNTPFNQPLNNWERIGSTLGNVTDMSTMFYNTPFNQPIGNWNVSSVTNMENMFTSSSFNQPLNNWERIGSTLGNVTNMSNMFFTTPFNQPIGNWNVSSVTNMGGMFQTTPFNQPLNNWERIGSTLGNVTDMNNMFLETLFNQDISNWNVSNVETMTNMFDTSPFNQDLSNWNVESVINIAGMFQSTNLSYTNYDNILNAWSILPVLQSNVNFTNIGLMYSINGKNAHDTLISDYNWNLYGNIEKTESPLILIYDFPDGFAYTPPILDTDGISEIDWGDGSPLDTVIPHTYTTNEIYTVKIYGSLTETILRMSNVNNNVVNTSAQHLLRCTTFGNIGITSLANAFSYCINLIEVPQILPSSVSNLDYCFTTQYETYQYIDLYVANWDISNVTSMQQMFSGLVLSTSTYNLLLNNWSKLTVTPNIIFSSSNLIYTDGKTGRNILTSSPNNWSIVGDVLLPSNIYKNTEFTITYNDNFNIGDTIYLYFGDTLIDTVVYDSSDTFIIFTAVPLVTGTIVFTIQYDNSIIFTGSFNVLKQLICTPTVKPTYTFSEQVSSSDRTKKLKDQVSCNTVSTDNFTTINTQRSIDYNAFINPSTKPLIETNKQICNPIINPSYTFSEQVSSSDRTKKLKERLICNNI